MTAPLPFAFFSATPGPSEVLLVFLAILILFGAKRLPEIARMLGKGVDELRRASRDFHDQITAADDHGERGGEDSPRGREPGSVPGEAAADTADRDVESSRSGDEDEDGVDKQDLAG